MTERTGGELLVACLEAQGVVTGFGVPGESYLAVLDALHDSPIDYVICRQEGGAAYAAEAWGKLTGEPGIAFVTRGPGATNASVGLHTAMQDSTPMILFVGQASTVHLGREAFQEVDYRTVLGPLVKWATQIEHAERIPEVVGRAFTTALSGRPGPVVVALPEDVLAARTDTEPGERVRVPEPAPGPADVAAMVELLDSAERPLVLVGGGGWRSDGRLALARFAEANELPVAIEFRRQELVDNESPSYTGEAGIGMLPHIRRLIIDADVILAVGVRFDEMLTGTYELFAIPDPAQTVIHVHASDGEFGKVVQPQLPVHAGPNRTMTALAERSLTDPTRWRDWTRDARETWQGTLVAPPQPGDLDMAQIMVWLQEHVPADAIFTNGAGNFSVWPNKHFRYGPDSRLIAPQSGSMGAGLPAAIAARIAHPDRMAVCFTGDGDFQMTMQELGTAAQAGAQPIVLVFNNGMYGTIRMHQERDFPGRVSGTDLANPDFVAIAAAYGFHAERVTTTDRFPGAFERAAASDSGALLELMVPPHMLSPHLSIDQLRTGR